MKFYSQSIALFGIALPVLACALLAGLAFTLRSNMLNSYDTKHTLFQTYEIDRVKALNVEKMIAYQREHVDRWVDLLAEDPSSAANINIRAIAETLPTFQRVPGWSGALLGPPGLSKPIVNRLHGAALKAINSPEVRAKLDEGGSLVMGITPEEFTVLLKTDLDRIGKIIKSLGIKVDEP